jgi:DNA-binding response OmpR family regulator
MINNTPKTIPYRSDTEKQFSIFIADARIGPTQLLAAHMESKGFLTQVFQESDSAIEQILSRMPDAVLLSTDLDPISGYEVCRTVRLNYNGPILIQGWNQDEASQLLAFERGADDYIILPASPVLLFTRIQSHLKRLNGWNGKRLQRLVTVGELMVDATRREVLLGGNPVNLTSTQFDLLWYLARRIGSVVSRKQLYEALYHATYNGYDRSVDVQISRIRQQLGDDSDHPIYLKTIRGVGYQFVSQA